MEDRPRRSVQKVQNSDFKSNFSIGAGNITARAMVNTILSGAFATFSYLLLYYIRKRKWSCLYGINACLAGKSDILASKEYQ